MRHEDFPPQPGCPLTAVAGITACRCGWSDHPQNAMPCEAAHDAAQDDAARRAIEGARDWRPPERLKKGGAPARFSRALEKEARFEKTAKSEGTQA